MTKKQLIKAASRALNSTINSSIRDDEDLLKQTARDFINGRSSPMQLVKELNAAISIATLYTCEELCTRWGLSSFIHNDSKDA